MNDNDYDLWRIGDQWGYAGSSEACSVDSCEDCGDDTDDCNCGDKL